MKIVYAGRQHKKHGTCGDISLIMLQELTAAPQIEEIQTKSLNEKNLII